MPFASGPLNRGFPAAMRILSRVEGATVPPPAGAVTQSAPKRILVVDDDPGVRESLLALLGGEGYQALPAAGGLQALALAACNPPDLVLLDLNLPGQNGWDTFELLTSKNPLLAVIVVTARPNQLFTACNAGVGALMEKPLDIPFLLRTIKTLLEEPAEERLARMAGRRAPFHYQPPERGGRVPKG